MKDPSLPLQAALITALKSTGALPSVVGGRVYDQPPATPTFPYITLGDCQIVPDKAGCIDGVEAFPVVDVWSRAVGYPEAKAISDAVIQKLDDQPLTVAGFSVTVFELQSALPLRDPDGQTRRVSITFRSLIQQV